jgi:putative flippase GtrA
MQKLAQFITWWIDLFYPLAKKFMPLQTFRYASCGVANVGLDIILYYISFQFILKKQILNLGFIAFEPYIAAILMAFCITFPIGFFLSKYVVWTQSNIKGKTQFFRYFLLIMANLFLNYVFIKLMVEGLNFYPTIAKMITTVIVIIFSYLTQKHFTFKTTATK